MNLFRKLNIIIIILVLSNLFLIYKLMEQRAATSKLKNELSLYTNRPAVPNLLNQQIELKIPEEFAFYLVVIFPTNVCRTCKVKIVENIDRLIQIGYGPSIIYLSKSQEDFTDYKLKNLILNSEDLESFTRIYKLNNQPILLLVKNNQIVCDFLSVDISRLYEIDDFILRNKNFLQIRSVQ